MKPKLLIYRQVIISGMMVLKTVEDLEIL